MKYIFLLMLLVLGGRVEAVDDGLLGNDIGSGFGGGDGTIGSDLLLESSQSSFDSTEFTTTAGGGSGAFTTTAGGRSGIAAANIQKPNGTIAGIIRWFIEILNYIVRGLITVALMFFLYGIVLLMFLGGTNEESRSKGKKFMKKMHDSV